MLSLNIFGKFEIMKCFFKGPIKKIYNYKSGDKEDTNKAILIDMCDVLQEVNEQDRERVERDHHKPIDQ